jgi:penicillin-binding protein 2
MNIRKLIVVLGCVALLVVACGGEGAPASQPGAPTVPPSIADAENVARAFLGEWAAGNIDAMYGLLSPRSLAISREAFADAYQRAEQTLNLAAENAKSFEILSDKTARQGTTAIIYYNMTFNSNVLGKFTDPERAMRLVISPRGWRVAWSAMDIFEGMAGGATLQLIRTTPKRGAIYDRSGKVIAADDVPNYAIRLLTRQYPTGNPDQCLDLLADTFRIYRPDLERYKQFTGQDYGFTVGTMFETDWSAMEASLRSVCLLEARPQTTRFYYRGGIGVQAVGFVGPVQADQVGQFPNVGPDALVGQFGIERYWQNQLGGMAGAQLVISTPDNVLVRTIYSRDSAPGQDVRLTLDRDLQLITDQSLAQGYNAANWARVPLPLGAVRGAAIIILDVKSGAVLAMSSYPAPNPDAWQRNTTTFDADTISNYVNAKATVNHGVEETYSLGSVMKIASMAAAADSGAFRLNEIVDCKGTFKSPDDGRTLTDWIYLEPGRNPNYHGPINLPQALTSSCDIYYWTIAVRLNGIDPAMLRKYGNQLGLGVRTGIDALYEETGVIPDPAWKRARGGAWGVGDNMNIVIGQGDLQVTVLQVARMLAGVANGEMLPIPFLVREVGAPGQAATYVASPGQSPPLGLKPEVLAGVRAGMCEVTSNGTLGTAQWVFRFIDQSVVQVCGKTGTVQSGTTYPHGWFAAYVGKPGQPPDIAIAGIALYSREGSETVAPIVRRIVQRYYGLPITPWPQFWSQPYEALPTPGLGEGGPRE